MIGTIDDVRKIAVLRANAIGDYIFCLPALDSLKAAYPGAELVLLGDTWHVRDLAGRPGPVDRVLLAPAVTGVREPHRGEPPPSESFAKARAEGFDIAVQLHGGGRHSNPVVNALGARVTAGLRAADAPPLDRDVPYLYFQPEVFRYLEVAGLVGAPPVTYRPRFRVSEDDVAQAHAVAGPPVLPRVAVHPGATDARRRWPAQRFAVVADMLTNAGAQVVLTGGSDDGELVAEVAASARRPVTNLAGALSLGGLAGLYSGCALMIANDTGPLHLAEAVGTPTVGLYWPGNMINCAPVDRTHHRPIVSWNLNCPVCDADCTPGRHPARGGDTSCPHRVSFITDIEVPEVLEQALSVLSRSR